MTDEELWKKADKYVVSTGNNDCTIDAYIAGYHECQEEHEWHYVNWKYFADKDYPESETVSYLVRLRNKDVIICDWETEEGFGCFWDNLQPVDNNDVYAWKEIVLPNLSSSE